MSEEWRNVEVYHDGEEEGRCIAFKSVPSVGDHVFIGDNCYFRVNHVVHVINGDYCPDVKIFLGPVESDPSESSRSDTPD